MLSKVTSPLPVPTCSIHIVTVPGGAVRITAWGLTVGVESPDRLRIRQPKEACKRESSP